MSLARLAICVSVSPLALALTMGCGADYGPERGAGAEPEAALDSAEQTLAACDGDDSNSVAAALAVAAANELGRWDALSDFQLVNGRLQLSPTGEIRCEGWRNDSPGGCENIRAVLALQLDASAVLPNHDPAALRTKLSTWYRSQQSALAAARMQKTRLEKGVFRIRSAATARYLAVDGQGSVQQAPAAGSEAAAAQWNLTLDGTTYELENVATGQCLDLAYDYPGSVRLTQRACGKSSTQDFRLLSTGGESYAITTKYPGHALLASAPANADSFANVTQSTFNAAQINQRWVLEPYGSGPHAPISEIQPGVYALGIRHSGRYMGVDGGQMRDGARIEQRTYEAWDDRYNWYINHGSAGSAYEVVNRRSGKCLDLEVPAAAASGLVQRRCSGAPTQRFTFRSTGDGHYLMLTANGKAVEIPYASQTSDARFAQGASATTAAHRQFVLTPVIAGEPHVLTFSEVTEDGPCGNYYWYDITQANGQPLQEPAESYEQLIFAGGKTTLTGIDPNPFISQRVSGNRVAIDPTYGLNAMPGTSSGTCSAACVKFSLQSVAGQCCSCNGVRRTYERSSWSSTTYVCQ